MATLESFEELECYQANREFRKAVSTFCRSLPKEEEYRLKDQLLRASRSVTANIAEGFGRHHHQENLQFCRQARGSLTECLDHLNVAIDEGFLTQALYERLRALRETGAKLLNGYIAYLQRVASAQK
jgi:four helix bundle protein